MRPPTLTPAAVEFLAGRPLVLRASPRHGCCGGHALVPVAEVGPPTDPGRYERLADGPLVCFIESGLGPSSAEWRVDAVGFGRWRRLYLDGAESGIGSGSKERPVLGSSPTEETRLDP